MTGELYIYKRRNRFQVSKKLNDKTRNFGYYDTLEDAIFARDLLMEHDWDLSKIAEMGNVVECGDEFLIVTIHDNKLKFLEKFKTRTGAEGHAEKIISDFRKNPHGSKYGMYIYKWNDHFEIRKTVDGKDQIFGYYRNIDDATFARDLLMEYNWDLKSISDDGPIHYSQIHNQYIAMSVSKNKLIVVNHYDSEDDALNNAEEAIENYNKSKYGTGEKYVVFNGKLFAVHYYTNDNKIIYFGSFSEKIDAITVRDILIENNWDLALVDENRIYECNNYFWKLHVFEGTVKVIGKYESLDDAQNDANNMSKLTLEELYDPENPYSKVIRYITKKSGLFWIRKKINDEIQYIGPYESREEAIEARDEFEDNGWDLAVDKDSIFSADMGEDRFSDIVSGLSMWQKIIYDTIDRIGNMEFSFDELINHSYLKRYRSGKNFEAKVDRYLNELIDLGLVSDMGDGLYFREF